MRFNEKELKLLSTKRPSVQGTLQYLKPQGSDWSDWYQQSVYKDRVFKLIQNLLFYYRTADLDDPLGVFVLEQMEVAYEAGPAPFTFSLTSNDGKHIFACRCQEDLNKWVAALKVASYTYWKSQHEVLLCKLARCKGTAWTSPYNQQPKPARAAEDLQASRLQQSFSNRTSSTFYESANNDNNVPVITKRMSKSTFYSQSEVKTTSSATSATLPRREPFESSITSYPHPPPKAVQSNNVPVDNLIDL